MALASSESSQAVDFSMNLALPVTTSSFLLALVSCLAHLPSLLTSLLSLLSILSSRVLDSPFSPLGNRRREDRERREQWWPEERREEPTGPRLVAEKWLL